ncbi:MAG: cobalamin B12-binding domain-containing protein [Coriobacteriales bacterium]|nr:cobalamin B12-binding domain-containing protein [Coriobacteriales bacterium]
MAESAVGDGVTQLYEAFVARDPARAIAVVEASRSAGLSHEALLDKLYAPALSLLGGAWASGRLDEYAFTQAAVTAEQVSTFVIPSAAALDTGVTVLVGAIEGDEHSIAKTVAGAALKQAGNRVIDLGEDVRPSTFFERAEESGAWIILVSAETEEAADRVSRVREHFDAAGREVIIFVTGGPFEADDQRARTVGANGVSRGAESAMRLVAGAAARLGDKR